MVHRRTAHRPHRPRPQTPRREHVTAWVVATLGVLAGISNASHGWLARNAWSVPETAGNHAGVLGMMGGFMATIIVLYLVGEKETRRGSETVAVLLTAFLHCVSASVLYAVLAGNQAEHQPAVQALVDQGGSPPYLIAFQIVGIGYYLAVYLTFSGLYLIVVEQLRDLSARIAAANARACVFVIGTLWVLGDLLASRTSAPGGTAWGTVLLCLGAAVYLVGAGGWPAFPWWPRWLGRGPRTEEEHAALLVRIGIWLALAIAVAGGLWLSPNLRQQTQAVPGATIDGLFCLAAVALGVFHWLVQRHLHYVERHPEGVEG